MSWDRYVEWKLSIYKDLWIVLWLSYLVCSIHGFRIRYYFISLQGENIQNHAMMMLSSIIGKSHLNGVAQLILVVCPEISSSSFLYSSKLWCFLKLIHSKVMWINLNLIYLPSFLSYLKLDYYLISKSIGNLI